MKKAKILLPLFALMSLAGCSGATLAEPVNTRRAVSRSETLEHYIPTYVDGNLTVLEGGADCGGKNASPEGTFWDTRNFNALDNFYAGIEREGWTGKLQTKTWTQKTRYISFLIAGMKDPKKMYIEVYVNDVKVDTITNKYFNNPYVSCNMVLTPYILPAEAVTDAQLNEGVQMRLVLVDNCTEDYGFINFGSLFVNQTKEDVARTLSIHQNSLSRSDVEGSPDAHKDSLARNYLLNVYNTHEDFQEFREVTLTNANNDFEDEYGINNLAFDRSYLAYNSKLDLMYNKAICNWESNMDDNQKIPYNATNGHFFKGFYEGNDTTFPRSGFVASDNYRYRFLTNSFVLSGTGLVSIKMSGRPASLHVLNGDPTSADYLKELAFVDNKTYTGMNNENIALNENGSSCTMVRHIINLESFKGQKICLGIADYDTKGEWGAINFDEIVTYYETYPSFKVDVVTQANKSGTKYATLLDCYVSSVNPEGVINIKYVNGAAAPDHDSAPNAKAYTFLKDYYNTFRAKNNGQTYCGVGDIETKANNLNATYKTLTAEEKAIVDASEDYARNGIGNVSEANEWYTKEVLKNYTVGQSLSYIFGRYTTSSASSLFLISLSSSSQQTAVFVTIMSAALLVTSICFFVVIRNRKKENN